MINKQYVEIYLHLFYKEPSLYLLEKIRKYYDGGIKISFNDNGKANEEILSYARDNFENVDSVIVDNLGNDQHGFFNLTKKYPMQKEWTLYCHDKTIKRIDWLDEILDPIFFNEEKVAKLLSGEEAGIISSSNPNYCHNIMTEEDLTELSRNKNFDSRLKIIQARHTLTWYRELQYILLTNTGFIETDNLNPKFTAGNMFLARSSVVKMCHSCVHESYFENYYREDGNVEHAMERFYYYVSKCLKYKNVFISLDGDLQND